MGKILGVFLESEPINAESLTSLTKDVRLGGVVTFTGEVRSLTGDMDTSKLIYEAHESMAIAQMTQIASFAAEKWDANVAISHRIGELMPGDIAVVCVAACAHRNQAFECCRYLIDQIKQDVPIWKKEFGSSGEAWVAGDLGRVV